MAEINFSNKCLFPKVRGFKTPIKRRKKRQKKRKTGPFKGGKTPPKNNKIKGNKHRLILFYRLVRFLNPPNLSWHPRVAADTEADPALIRHESVGTGASCPPSVSVRPSVSLRRLPSSSSFRCGVLAGLVLGLWEKAALGKGRGRGRRALGVGGRSLGRVGVGGRGGVGWGGVSSVWGADGQWGQL